MKSRVLAGLFLSAIALCILSNSARAQLYVSQQGNGTVAEYDAATGALINSTFVTGLNNPFSLALSGNDLFVACSAATEWANTTPPREPPSTLTSSPD